MEGRNSRIITIVIPKTENSEEISFCISLSRLQKLFKKAVKNGYETIQFNVNSQTVNLSIDQVKLLIRQARFQFKTQIEIPKRLQTYVRNLSQSISTLNLEKLSARDEEIEKLWTCLCLNQKSNAILVGDHGVGKTTLAFEVTRQILIKECPKQLYRYSILEINALKLLELEQKSIFIYEKVLINLFEFVKANKEKVILYIDNLLYVKCEALLLKCFLLWIKTDNIKLIASISIQDFENFFEDDVSLMKYLNPILLEEPEVEEIYPMLKTRIDKMQKAYGVKISKKMIRFAILTGLHLASSNSSNPESTLDIINFALADAKRKDEQEVKKVNILSYYYIDFKLEKKTDEDEKWITAYHEAGHYLVSKMSQNIKNFKNAFVSILPIEGALGLTASYEDFGKQLTFSKKYYIDEIAFFLGGRVGETIYTNEFSSGAQQDLMQANAMAEQLVLAYGLSEIEGEQNKNYMIGGYVKDFLLTDEIRLKINTEILKIIDEAYDRAKKIINENQKLLTEIAKKLVEDGILMGDELDELCKKYQENSENSFHN
jgi:ATP-dependent Clp protease ATP-binding subunit ClpA